MAELDWETKDLHASFISVLVVGHLVRSQHLPTCLPAYLPTIPKVERSAVLVQLCFQVLILYCIAEGAIRNVAWNNSKSNSTYAILPAALLCKGPNCQKVII